MAEGSEWATILPRSNAARIFAQSYSAARKRKDALNLRKDAAAAKADAAKAKREQQVADTDDKLFNQLSDNIYSPNVEIQKRINESISKGYQAGIEAHKAGKTGADYYSAIRPHIDEAVQLKSWGDNLKSVSTQLQDQYGAINGLNKGAVEPIILDYFNQNKSFGKGDLSPATLRNAVEARGDELVTGPKAVDDYFKTLGTQNVGVRTSANGLRTGGGESYTIPNDAVLSGEGKSTVVLPKAEAFDLETSSSNRLGDKPVIKAQNFIATELGNKGQLMLYDKDNFNKLMADEGARRVINKEFNQKVKKYNSENPGTSFPTGGQLEEYTKRAIAYNYRKGMVDGKYNQAIERQQFHISVNAGGNGKTSGDVPVNELYDRIDAVTDNEQPIKIFGINTGKKDYQPVPVTELDDDAGNHVLDFARKRLTSEEAKGLDATNVFVRKNGQKQNIVIVTVPPEPASAFNNYQPKPAQTKQVGVLTRLGTDVKAQPGQKGKNKVIAREKQIAVPKTILKGKVR